MNMRVMRKRLTPSVQYGDRANLSAEIALVGGDVAQGLGRSAEQDTVDHLLVVEGEFGHRRGYGEHHVEVGHRQQVGLARFQPLCARQALALRTMAITAGVVRVANEAAVGTLLGMPA